MLGPYNFDFMTEVTREIVTLYPVDGVFSNRWEFIVALHERMREKAVVPEYELFDLGHLASLERLLSRHGLPHGEHVHVDFVLGVPGGAETAIQVSA